MLQQQNLDVFVDAVQLESNHPGEDRFCIREKVFHGQVDRAYAVIDGHGGHVAADLTLIYLLDTILQRIGNIPHPRCQSSVANEISCSFCEVDEIILATVKESAATHCKKLKAGNCFDMLPSQSCRAGCCAVVVVIADASVFVAHVGDCRAVLFQKSSQENFVKLLPDTDIDCLDDLASCTQKINELPPDMCNVDVITDARLPTSLPTPPSATASGSPDNYLQIVALSEDHSSHSKVEVDLVRSRTSDADPFRCSRNDHISMRVAGSLSVTRALGDAYLKCKDLSAPPFSAHVPYITATPTVSCRPLPTQDSYIILASDGLWNFLSSESCAAIIAEELFKKSDSVSHMETPEKRLPSTSSEQNSGKDSYTTNSNSLSGTKRPRNFIDDMDSIAVDSHVCQGQTPWHDALLTHKDLCDCGFVPNKKLQSGPLTVYSSRKGECPKQYSDTKRRKQQIGIIRKCIESVESPQQTAVVPVQLLHECVNAAAKDAGLCAKQLMESCHSRFKKKHVSPPAQISCTRRYIDDVTIMLVQLEYHTRK